MAATPLLLACGAGAAAGSAFLVMQERQRLQRVAAMRAIDKREQEMLAQAGASLASFPDRPALQQLRDAPPVWVMLVHLGEAQLSERLLGKKLKVVVKYGERGWSLKRDTAELLCADSGEGQGPIAAFKENCVFLLRRGLAPRVRLRLMRRGLTHWKTMAKQDLLLNLDGNLPFWQEGVWKLIYVNGKRKSLLGSLRMAVEVRPFSLEDLCSHGLNVGQVVPRVTLADVADPQQPELPLLQGEAVAASPDAVREMQRAEERRRAENHLRRLRDEAPDAETDSEDDSSETRSARADDRSSSSGESSSEADSSSEDERTSRTSRRSACPNPFHCPS